MTAAADGKRSDTVKSLMSAYDNELAEKDALILGLENRVIVGLEKIRSLESVILSITKVASEVVSAILEKRLP